MTRTLGELRYQRDAAASRAAAALEKHWRKPMAAFIEEIACRPFKHSAGVTVLADALDDHTERAAVLNYLSLCEQVWERESEALEHLPPHAYGEHCTA